MKPKRDQVLLLRPGTEADVDDFIRIWRAIWHHSFAAVLDADLDEPAFKYGMEHAELIPVARRMIVAVLDGRVVGYCFRDGAHIDDLWVDPPAQGRGIGGALLAAAVSAITGDGYRTATLDCIEANAGARRFYERQGWRPAFRFATWSQSLGRYLSRIRFEFDTWRTRPR